MARKRTHTEETAAIALRCRSLGNAVQAYECRAQPEVFADHFSGLSRLQLARLMDGTTRKWRVDDVDRLTALVRDRYRFPTQLIRAHLVGGELVDGPLCDLIFGRLHADRTKSLARLDTILAERFDRATGAISSVVRRCPFNQMSDEFVEAHLDYEEHSRGLTATMRLAKAKLIKGRQVAAREGSGEVYSNTTMGLLDSGLQELRSRQGHARFLGATGAWDQLAQFGQFTVRALGIEVRVVPDSDGSLDLMLQQWIDRYDVVVAVGANFLMKVYRDSSKRVFLERAGDPIQDRLLDLELSRLHALLGCHRHETGTYALSELFKKMADSVEQAKTAARQRKLDKRRRDGVRKMQRSTDSEQGFWTSNGIWVPYQ